MKPAHLCFLGHLAAVRFTLNHALYDPRTDTESASVLSLLLAQRMAKLAWREYSRAVSDLLENPTFRQNIANDIRIGRSAAREANKSNLTPLRDPARDHTN
jgi:hypothetical protein